jgi:hypothetical protein
MYICDVNFSQNEIFVVNINIEQGSKKVQFRLF